MCEGEEAGLLEEAVDVGAPGEQQGSDLDPTCLKLEEQKLVLSGGGKGGSEAKAALRPRRCSTGGRNLPRSGAKIRLKATGEPWIVSWRREAGLEVVLVGKSALRMTSLQMDWLAGRAGERRQRVCGSVFWLTG